jgi:hypothetical protein
MQKTDDILNDSFNQDFCTDLEFHLCLTFENSHDDRLNGFRCDGVSHEPLVKSKKSINDNRQLVTKAWIGKTGQDEYEMTIHFGKYSLRRFAKGTSLADTLPSNQSMHWVKIDTDNRTIEIQLL